MKFSPAYTLIELLVVIAIIGLLSLGGVTAFITAKNNQDLSHASDHLVDTIRRAHIFSRDGRDEKEWGVQSFQNNEYRIVVRDNPSDPAEISASYSLPKSVQIVFPFELWFGKGTGETDNSFVISLKNINDQKTTVRVEKTGVVSFIYE